MPPFVVMFPVVCLPLIANRHYEIDDAAACRSLEWCDAWCVPFCSALVKGICSTLR